MRDLTKAEVPTDHQAELRRRWRAVNKAQDRARAALAAAGVPVWELARHLPRVDWQQFEGLRCGAKGKRMGRPCALRDIHANGRCKFHGGMSTGPKTPEGKARCADNGRKLKRSS